MIASQIVAAFFVSGVSFVMTGKPASEEIAGKLSLDSQVVSLWQIRTELFQSRRFSGFCGFTSSIVHRKDQNPHFPVARWGNVLPRTLECDEAVLPRRARRTQLISCCSAKIFRRRFVEVVLVHQLCSHQGSDSVSVKSESSRHAPP